jgi:hypothetical protein
MSVELEVAMTTKLRQPSQHDALAELRTWYLGSLRPKLVHAGAAGIVPPAATDALDQSLRELLDLPAPQVEEAA